MAASFNLLLQFLVTLTFVKILQCSPLPQQIFETFPQIPISTPALLTDNNGVRIINQSHPLYYILSKSSTPTSAVASSQGIISANYGNNQFVQTPILPVSGAVEVASFTSPVYSSASESEYFGWGSQNSGAQKVSLNPLLQSVKQDLQSLPILYQSNSLGGLMKNSNTLPNNYSINNGILGITSTNGVQTTIQQPSITSSYQQSLVRPAINKDAVVALTNSEGVVPATATGVPSSYTSSSAINANAFGSNINQNKGTFVTSPVPNYNYGILESALKNFGLSTSGVAGPAFVPTILQSPGLQTQIVQVPCTLNIPSPVPITVNPGVSQISTYLPTQQTNMIPSSYIDQSPPTVAILRPPTESENFPIAAPALTTIVAQQASQPTSANSHFIIDSALTESSLATTINEQTKQKARHQDSRGVPIQNNDELASEIKSEFAPGLARHGLPIVYTVLPPFSSPSPGAASGSTAVVETNSGGKNKNSSKPQQQQPTRDRGTNPFFNVNKRKHFEFYQYF